MTQESFIKWFDETYENANDAPESLNIKIEVLGEKESTQQYLDSFKEHLDNGISKCEKEIKSRISEEWKKIEEKVSRDQHKRNRMIVEQIIKTTDKFRKENEGYFFKLREEYDEG